MLVANQSAASQSLTASSLSSIAGITTVSEPLGYLTDAASSGPLPKAHNYKPPEIEACDDGVVTAKKLGQVKSDMYFGYIFPNSTIITNCDDVSTMMKYSIAWASTRAAHVSKWVEGTEFGVINRADWRAFLQSILNVINIDPTD
jgi:hypothetical protein